MRQPAGRVVRAPAAWRDAVPAGRPCDPGRWDMSQMLMQQPAELPTGMEPRPWGLADTPGRAHAGLAVPGRLW